MPTRKHPSYIHNIPSGRHFRIKVPADVRSLIGKAELKHSFTHPSEKEAYTEAMRQAVIAFRMAP